eukprot:Skav204376  [mRNA]  locus=scaffold4897:57638:58729:- [translate_table: standard]
MVEGRAPALVCMDCYWAFSPKAPKLCRFALANDLWLGRVDPLLWDANMTHQMCLALARTVATKVVLKSGGAQPSFGDRQWDEEFHQSGMVGSSVVFHNGDAKHALESLPPQKLNDALAITFCTTLPNESQESGRHAVSKIKQFRLDKTKFLEQAHILVESNPVYKCGVRSVNETLLTEWCAGGDGQVPSVVLDCVVSVPVGVEGPGVMRQEGPAQATAGNIAVEQEESVLALEPHVRDYNEDCTDVTSKIVALLEKLEELEAAGSRSVAIEMASVIEGDVSLVDHIGRDRILKLCEEVKVTCEKLSVDAARRKLELELRDAVMGKSRWLLEAEKNAEDGPVPNHLLVARGKQPLSLFDWKITG